MEKRKKKNYEKKTVTPRMILARSETTGSASRSTGREKKRGERRQPAPVITNRGEKRKRTSACRPRRGGEMVKEKGESSPLFLHREGGGGVLSVGWTRVGNVGGCHCTCWRKGGEGITLKGKHGEEKNRE